jgi:hypothetical protein
MEGDSIQLLEWVRIFINTWLLECDHEAISTEFEVPTHECAVHHDKVNKKRHPVQFVPHFQQSAGLRVGTINRRRRS